MKRYNEYIKENFEEDLNVVANDIHKTGGFHKVWDFADKYPDQIKKNEFENAHDRFLVPLSNSNHIRKRITETEKIWMLFHLLTTKQNFEYSGDFNDWVENGKLTIYRGTPDRPTTDELPANKFLSFTLNKDYAKKFFQDDWAEGGWVDEDASGYLITATMSIKNNFHIYNNAGWEEEVVVKGPLKFDKIEYI